MEATLHRFVRLLRLGGVRVSIPEALDAMRCASQPGVLADREVLRTALRVALIKDQRDEPVFDEIFDAFFSLVRVGGAGRGHGHGHGHEDLTDTGELEAYTMSEEPSETPQQGHEHGKPADIRQYFDQQNLAQRYNLHQEANKIDLAALTDEIAFSKETDTVGGESYRVAARDRAAARCGGAGNAVHRPPTQASTLSSRSPSRRRCSDGWPMMEDQAGDEDDAAALRRRLAGVLANLPEALKRHLEALLQLENRIVETRERREAAQVDRIAEIERAELEESLRRLARTLHGALTHRRRIAAAGRVDSGRDHAAQHAVRRSAVRAGHGAARRGPATAGRAR